MNDLGLFCRMFLLRLLLSLISLGVAAYLGYTAYSCWAVAVNLGAGPFNFAGLSLSFPLGMSLLVVLSLLFALLAIYGLFFPNSEN